MRLYKLYGLFCLVLLAACQTQVVDEPSNPFLADPLHCNVDADCTCGGKDEAGNCFIGNKLYASMHVDASQCPDFCGGIAGNLELRCVENQCQQVERELKACTEEAKVCPDGTVVTRQGPDCEFASCPVVEKTIKLRTVTWESWVPPEDITSEIVSEFAARDGLRFGPDELFSVSLEEGVRVRSSEPLVECDQPVSKAEIQDVVLSTEELCLRTGSMDGGQDYYLLLVTPQERCGNYSRTQDGVQSVERLCATCGDGVCEPAERGRSSSIVCTGDACAVTTDLGPLYCLEDCAESAAECQTASDCVQASCCHATACVPKDQAPTCDGVMCTMECQPGTLDCGGSCGCVEGKCVGQNFFGE